MEFGQQPGQQARMRLVAHTPTAMARPDRLAIIDQPVGSTGRITGLCLCLSHDKLSLSYDDAIAPVHDVAHPYFSSFKSI
jgi:hypothetical protein